MEYGIWNMEKYYYISFNSSITDQRKFISLPIINENILAIKYSYIT